MVMVAPGVDTANASAARVTALPDPEGRRVEKCWKEASEDLQRQRRDYWLNLSYYMGEQWIWWDRTRRVVQQLPQQYSPLGPGRARVTINKLAPNIGSVMGRMLKSELTFEVLPSGIADDVSGGARLGERTLTAYHRNQDWEIVRFDALLAAVLGGTSAVALDWDGTKGKMIAQDARTNQITATGEPRLRALNIGEFGIEPKVRETRDATWWCEGLALPPKSVQEMYGLTWMPKPDVGALSSPLQQRMMSDAGRGSGERLVLVLTYYERPNRRSPQGAMRVVVNGQCVTKKPWPFPFEDLNLETFRCRKLPSQWSGTTYVNDAIQIQFAYNHARSVIAEHMKLAGNARLMAPYGSFDEEALTDDPGSVLWWSPDGLGGANVRPDYLSPPQLPSWMRDEAGNLATELDDVMFVHDVSRGEGFDRASGQALAVLGEKDDSPLGQMVFEQQRGWSRLGSKVLKILAKKGQETRTMTIPAAPGIPEVVEWNGKMLREQFDVQVPLESVEPRTRASQMAFAKDLWDRQIITDPRQYAQMSGLPRENFAELLNADAARAQRENLRMMAGYVELPEDFDDHGVHISEHNRERKSDSYKFAPAEIRSLIDDHIKYHEMKAHQELAQQTMRAATDPALAMVPQANAPVGSEIPPTAVEQQAQMAQMAGGTGGASNAPNMGPGGTSPGMAGLAGMVTAPPEPAPAGGGAPA